MVAILFSICSSIAKSAANVIQEFLPLPVSVSLSATKVDDPTHVCNIQNIIPDNYKLDMKSITIPVHNKAHPPKKIHDFKAHP